MTDTQTITRHHAAHRARVLTPSGRLGVLFFVDEQAGRARARLADDSVVTLPLQNFTLVAPQVVVLMPTDVAALRRLLWAVPFGPRTWVDVQRLQALLDEVPEAGQ